MCKKLPVLVGPLSAILSFGDPLTFNFHWSLGYIRKLAFGSPAGNSFTLGFVCSQHTEPRNIKFAQTPLSKGTNSHIGDSVIFLFLFEYILFNIINSNIYNIVKSMQRLRYQIWHWQRTYIYKLKSKTSLNVAVCAMMSAQFCQFQSQYLKLKLAL